MMIMSATLDTQKTGTNRERLLWLLLEIGEMRVINTADSSALGVKVQTSRSTSSPFDALMNISWQLEHSLLAIAFGKAYEYRDLYLEVLGLSEEQYTQLLFTRLNDKSRQRLSASSETRRYKKLLAMLEIVGDGGVEAQVAISVLLSHFETQLGVYEKARLSDNNPARTIRAEAIADTSWNHRTQVLTPITA